MKAACMNEVPGEPGAPWHRCGWVGEVKSLTEECPRCLSVFSLAPVVDLPMSPEAE